jgi:hypothetical protein
MTELPVEYKSLVYLHRYVGCVKTVEFACKIWNEIHQLDSLRLKRVKESESTITVTGKCQDLGFFLSICRYLTALGVDVQHEKIIMKVELEV